MKILTLCVIMASFSAGAMMKKPSIDGALSHKYDENYEETHRTLAGSVEKEKVEAEKSDKSESDRMPSSQGEAFEQSNENGIRYWKY